MTPMPTPMPADLPTTPTPEATQKGWAPANFGRRWQLGFFYWIMRLGGRARGYHMANIVSLWYVLVSPSIRRRCRYYLDRRFPQKSGPLRRFWRTYTLIRTYASTLVDGMVRRMFGPDSVAHRSPDHDRLRAIAAEPGGLIVIHAHVGSWQVGMSTLAEFGRNVAIVSLPDAGTMELAQSARATFIDPRDGLRCAMEMSQALLRGDVLVMMGDRTLGGDQNSIPVPFLGAPAMFPITPYRLASATGAPVLVMTGPKTRGAYELRLARVIRVPPGLGRKPDAYGPYARQFVDCIEAFVRDFPWQFYNFYDMWKPADPAVTRQPAPAEPR